MSAKTASAYRVQLALIVEVQTAACDGEVVDLNLDNYDCDDIEAQVIDAIEAARESETWLAAVSLMSSAAGQLKKSLPDSIISFTPFVGVKEAEEI